MKSRILKIICALAAGLVVAITLIAIFDPPPSEAESSAASAKESETEPVSAPGETLGCDQVMSLARTIQEGKRKGATEDEAIAALRELGPAAYSLSYVVDGVYRSPPDTPDAIIVGEAGRTCRRLAEGGTIY